MLYAKLDDNNNLSAIVLAPDETTTTVLPPSNWLVPKYVSHLHFDKESETWSVVYDEQSSLPENVAVTTTNLVKGQEQVIETVKILKDSNLTSNKGISSLSLLLVQSMNQSKMLQKSVSELAMQVVKAKEGD